MSAMHGPSDATQRRVRLLISGRVQGVGYRASAQDEAEALGLRGWVRNLHSGQVELAAEGPPEAVEALVRWCRRGPPGGRVTEVELSEEAPAGEPPGFRVRPRA
jgi:acylphosphatase